MQTRILTAFVAGIVLGCICTLLGVYTYSLPGRAIQSLQDENELLRETIATMEQERAEIQAILKAPAEAPAQSRDSAEPDLFGESAPPAGQKPDPTDDLFASPTNAPTEASTPEKPADDLFGEPSIKPPNEPSPESDGHSDVLDDLFKEG
jgi:hypothetical protein